MTIFHSLKYPISDPPTREELQALPKEIFEEWCQHIIVHQANYVITVDFVASVLQTHLKNDFLYPFELQRLKRLIYEYESDK